MFQFTNILFDQMEYQFTYMKTHRLCYVTNTETYIINKGCCQIMAQ